MAHTITTESGPQFTVAADEVNLLRAALRAGLGFPYECSVGGCGGCRFDLLEGEVTTLWPQAPGLSERDRKRGKRLACQTQIGADARIRVRLDPSQAPIIPPQRLSARLVERRQLTHDMAELTFQLEGKVQRSAQFLPGQYALLTLPGVPGDRAYSMSNLPNPDGQLQFIVRRTGGSGSVALVDDLALDQTITIDYPYGHAYYRASTNSKPLICIAGGSGLAPMLSVTRAAVADGATAIDFIFGARTQADLCAEPALANLPGLGESLRLHTVLSAAQDDPTWTGERGFVHETLARILTERGSDFEFYFAGPPPMIDAVQQLLMVQWRVPFQQIHYDRFV